jgi:AbrB family looped-hinge helix DNA binding protein
MATASKSALPRLIRAKVTSKGQVTLPVEVRRRLGVKTGDHIRFIQRGREIVLVSEPKENVFEKWRGIGIEGVTPGPDGVAAYMREIRGYDEFDDNLA